MISYRELIKVLGCYDYAGKVWKIEIHQGLTSSLAGIVGVPDLIQMPSQTEFPIIFSVWEVKIAINLTMTFF